jgi:hypothetical protein
MTIINRAANKIPKHAITPERMSKKKRRRGLLTSFPFSFTLKLFDEGVRKLATQYLHFFPLSDKLFCN